MMTTMMTSTSLVNSQSSSSNHCSNSSHRINSSKPTEAVLVVGTSRTVRVRRRAASMTTPKRDTSRDVYGETPQSHLLHSTMQTVQGVVELMVAAWWEEAEAGAQRTADTGTTEHNNQDMAEATAIDTRNIKVVAPDIGTSMIHWLHKQACQGVKVVLITISQTTTKEDNRLLSHNSKWLASNLVVDSLLSTSILRWCPRWTLSSNNNSVISKKACLASRCATTLHFSRSTNNQHLQAQHL